MAKAPDLVGEGPLVPRRRLVVRAVRRGDRQPDQRFVPEHGRARRLREPADELTPTGGGRPIPVASGSSLRPDDPPRQEAGTLEPGKRRIDLGEIRSPERCQLVVDPPLQAVPGRWPVGEESEKKVRERHGATI